MKLIINNKTYVEFEGKVIKLNSINREECIISSCNYTITNNDIVKLLSSEITDMYLEYEDDLGNKFNTDLSLYKHILNIEQVYTDGKSASLIITLAT